MVVINEPQGLIVPSKQTQSDVLLPVSHALATRRTFVLLCSRNTSTPFRFQVKRELITQIRTLSLALQAHYQEQMTPSPENRL